MLHFWLAVLSLMFILTGVGFLTMWLIYVIHEWFTEDDRWL